MPPALVTRLEAANLSGASPTTVKKAVDQRLIPAQVRNSRSYIEADDVPVLVMFHLLAPMKLPLAHRRAVRRWLRDSSSSTELELSDAVVVRMVEPVEKARDRARRYARLRDEWIVRDPAIKGGEPVIKGTRVGVHSLASRIGGGEDAAILDEDYPHIPEEAREVAVQYARANPRRGRPKRSGPGA